MSILKNNILLFLALLMISCVKANDVIVFNRGDEILNVSPMLLIAEDEEDAFSFEQAMQLNYKKSENAVPNLGISKSAYWVKLEIQNDSYQEDLLLELSLPILDEVSFYYPVANQYKRIRTGETFVFSQRKYQEPNYLFDLYLNKGETKVFYLKVKSSEAIQLPIKIGTREALTDQIKNRDILSGIYFGIMLVMILYNLFVYFTVRDKSYILYVIYILLILLTQTSLQGYPFQYLWPNQPAIAKYSLFIFPSLVSIAGILFMLVFLKVKEYSKLLHRIAFIFFTTYSISIALAVLKQYQLSFAIMEFSSMTVSVYMLLTAIYVAKKGYTPAKYFVAAWVVFLCGVFVYILKDFEVFPYNDFTRYTMQIGSGIETILLSFALAARINIYKKERLDAVKENERLLQEQNIILEQKVDERTKELNGALEKLKNTQVQLVDAEKMSSLGQLTAGIAHEINNPINFVSSNVGPLKQDLDDLHAIIAKYEELAPENAKEKLAEIAALKDELDYDYLKKELISIIDGIEDGAKRTTEIVSGLRNFSRLDEGELKTADLNVGIKSTLVLVKNKLNGINVELDLAEKAECECNPGKINQVVMNLLDNAIDAIKEKHENDSDGKITITTQDLGDAIKLVVTDNGKGMLQEVISKVYDPFFTTKDVGEGTGLGLSIARGILENHNATYEIDSLENERTSFIITLPKTKIDGKD